MQSQYGWGGLQSARTSLHLALARLLGGRLILPLVRLGGLGLLGRVALGRLLGHLALLLARKAAKLDELAWTVNLTAGFK